MSKLKTTTNWGMAIVLAIGLSQTGCGKRDSASSSGSGSGGGEVTSVQNMGSDTMVNLAQAWSEEYHKVDPSVSIEVSGGGSGLGIAGLINGTAEIANSSRKLEPEEVEKCKAKHGHDPKEYMVGYDALSIFVHKNNPLNEISIEELGEIYKEGGKVTKWSDLGVQSIPGAQGDEIVRISRQNNSGTYHYFREVVIGKKGDFKAGSVDLNGSKDVVETIAKTPNAIGYSGMGYATPEVKIVKVAKKKGEPSVMPNIETTLNKTYPIARPMFMYTPGSPPPQIQKYLDWVLSDAGQKIVKDTGYVPLPKK